MLHPIDSFLVITIFQRRYFSIGEEQKTQQSKVIPGKMFLIFRICAFLDIIEESRLYKQIDDIVPVIIYNSCTENDKCTDLARIKPTDMYVAFSYPSMKFTFSFPDIIPKRSYYTFAFHLRKNMPCRLLLEDKKRFTRRPVIWKKEIVYNDPAIFEFSRKNESAVYEFALSIR